jgi:hypothetical protein
MRTKSKSRLFWLLICVLLLSLLFPIVASGQGRWNRGHSRGRVVVYSYPTRTYPVYRARSYYYRPRVIYQRPYYTQPYYNYYEPYGYYRPIYHRHRGRFQVYFRW